MKLLRTISMVVVITGLFVWFLVPFISAADFQSSDGITASSLVFYSKASYASWQPTALYWMPLVCVALLAVCLLFTLLDKHCWVGICSFAAIIAMSSGGRLAYTILTKSDMVGANLSVGYFLLLGIFGLLFGISIISMCKVKDSLHALTILAVIVGGVLWFVSPFLSYKLFHGTKMITPFTLTSAIWLEAFPSLKDSWQTSALYWMALGSAILLGVCLLFALLKDFRGVCVGSCIGVLGLVVGGILSISRMPFKPVDMHLGIGFFLLVGVFASLAALSIMRLIEIRDQAKREALPELVAEE